MRAWTGVGIAVGLVVLVGAVVAAVLLATGDDGDGDEFEQFERLLGATVVVEIGGTDEAPSDESWAAEQDDDPSLPGVFAASQGRGHFSEGWFGHAMTPFCEGVASSGLNVAVEATPNPLHAADDPDRCYQSNPPSSGRHLGVQRNVDIGGGIVINIPPDPDVYPHDVEIPRDAIPHILEHAGVFVGYHCAEGDVGCEAFVAEIEDLVNQRIDGFDDRVVMARDTDLPVGEIGLAAWTRVLNVRWDEAELDDIEEFISVHSCRFDPEGFC